jgi:ribosomal-protein-alanine N-acetyltransferase
LNPKLTFSPITLEDLDPIMSIEQQIYPNPWSVQVMQDCIQAGYQCIKGISSEYPDEVACYALMMIGYQESNLLNIGVNPKFQRQSIASQMMHRLLLISRINQAKYMWLEVRESNHAARGLYQKLNFETIGLRKNYYKYINAEGEKIKEHAILMSKKIGH